MDNRKEPDKRLPYEKPKLRMISLAAEEVLAINCKQSAGSSGKTGRLCGNNACKGVGGS